MTRVLMAAVVLAVPARAGVDDPKPGDATRADLKVLSGAWVTVGGEAKGERIPKDELPFRWTFKEARKLVFADRKQGTESAYAYAIDPAQARKAIDLTYEGPVAALKGAKQYGIYKVEGGMLTICLTLPGVAQKGRPTEFSTKEGRFMMWKLERVKDGN